MGIFDFFRRSKPEQRSFGTEQSVLFGPLGTLSDSGIAVSESIALTYSAYYGCVRLIAGTIASLPRHIIKDGDNGKEKDSAHPLSRIVSESPNQLMSGYSFWQTLVLHHLVWGNAYAYIGRDSRTGLVNELLPLLPDRSRSTFLENGQLVYITRTGKGEVALRPDEVYHVPALAFDGLKGMSTARTHANSIGIGSMAVGPRDFYSGLIDSVKSFNGPVQAGAEVLVTSTGTDLPIMGGDDTANVGQQLGENVEETNVTDATLANVILKSYKYSSKIMRVSIEMIQDNAFDLEGYITRKAGERIGRILNQRMTIGAGPGSSQPNGVVTASAVGKTAASTTTFTADELLDFYHSIDPFYRAAKDFRFMLHDSVLAFIRKFKDSQNRYLFEYGVNGEPNRILGAQYVINNDMPSAFTTGQKLIVGGDFSRYKVRYVNGVEVRRLEDRYAEFGQVGFIGFLRADANLADASALKHLKLA